MFYVTMRIGKQTSFKGFNLYSSAAFLENNVFLNKALFDVAGSDAPWVIMANNKEERRERLNRSILSFSLIFVSPLLLLPLLNRFAMKYTAKLTPKVFSKEYNAIRLSNKFLKNPERTKKGLEALAKNKNINFNELIDRAGGNWEKIRRGIIKAKNTVLAFDFLLLAGTFGNIGFFNNHQTKKRTGQKGFSAEMRMADKSVVEKRAEKYQKTANLRFGIFLASLAALTTAIPLGIKHGLSSNKISKFSTFIKKHAQKFDYTDVIFMKRWPLALALVVAQTGICLASRNKTELKDNAIRSSASYAIFFGGDLFFASLFGNLLDKTLKTKIIDRRFKNKNFLSKMLPPVKSLKIISRQSDKATKIAAPILFWFNFVLTAGLMGLAVPFLINKVIKKDVSNDVDKIQDIKGSSGFQSNKIKSFEKFVK